MDLQDYQGFSFLFRYSYVALSRVEVVNHIFTGLIKVKAIYINDINCTEQNVLA